MDSILAGRDIGSSTVDAMHMIVIVPKGSVAVCFRVLPTSTTICSISVIFQLAAYRRAAAAEEHQQQKQPPLYLIKFLSLINCQLHLKLCLTNRVKCSNSSSSRSKPSQLGIAETLVRALSGRWPKGMTCFYFYGFYSIIQLHWPIFCVNIIMSTLWLACITSFLVL